MATDCERSPPQRRQFPALAVLDLGDNNAGDEGAKYFAAVLWPDDDGAYNNSLVQLSLDWNR